MARKACIISVQHTGSRAITNCFRSGIDTLVTGNGEGVGNYMNELHMYSATQADVLALMSTTPTVYTMRDPLASLVSTLARQDETAAEHVSDWMMLKDAVDLHGGMPVAIDGINPTAQIQAVFDAYTLYDVPLPLESVGASSPTALTTAYKSGDWAYLVGAIPAEIGLLQAQESVLRPWLESHGYASLMWWS